MTEKLYWKDMYLREFDAHILGIIGNDVVLDRTAFYATGGGQPNDTGVMESKDREYRVLDVRKDANDVVHTLDKAEGLELGAKVHGKIDWERRYWHMRYHSAVHVLDGIVTSRHGDQGLLTGGQIYQDRARIDLDMNEFSREIVSAIIEESNRFIAEGHRIYQKEITAQEARSMENLARTAPGRELMNSLDTVRIIVIEGLDEQADGGTHVANTREIGRLVLNRIESKGKRNKRVEFHLENL
ncbi:MAG: alanyl-tRNA editing protein [Candidatus Thermoplasmatota archaeon]|nr:alanyl-tRNA editing protein [Candidatus Thermoplasmatota archaeon]